MSGDDVQARRTARNAAALGFAEVGGKAATFAYTVVAVRVLSQADFGAFVYAVSLALLVSPLPDWGFDKYMVRRGSRDRAMLPDLLGSVLVAKTGIALPAYTATVVFGALTRPTDTALLVLSLVTAATAIDLLADSERSAASVLQRQAAVAGVITLQRVLTAVLAMAALFMGTGVVGMAAAFLAGSVLGWVGNVLVVRWLGIRARLRAASWSSLRVAGRESGLLGLHSVLAMLLFRVDTIVIERLLDDEAVAAYGVAYRLVETVLFVSWSVTRATFPVMSERDDPRHARRAWERSIAAISTIYLPFGVVALVKGEAVLGLIFGAQYADAATSALQWLAPAPLLFAMAFLGGYSLIAINRVRVVAAASAIALVVNVGLNVLAIPHYGIAGAAMVTTVSIAAQILVLGILAASVMGVPSVPRALMPSALGAVLLALWLLLVDIHVLAAIAGGAPLFLAAWYGASRLWAPEQLRVVGALLPPRR